MRHLNIFFVVTTFIGILLPVVTPLNDRRTERRVFWAGFLIAAISAFFIAYPPDSKLGVALSVFACTLMLITAYFSTPYIKIRGKIYAFHIDDSRPDPSPDGTPESGNENPGPHPPPNAYEALGGTTAGKMWWLMVFAMLTCTGNVIGYFQNAEGPLLAGVMAAVMVVGATVYGYAADASPGYPIARGQHLQFVIISVITAGVFTIFYLSGYYAGKRWPLRRDRSLEYGKHSRQQKNDRR